MAPPRRAIIAVTSAHASLFDGKHTTGLFIGEALHPFNVFKKAGFEVDFVSVTGKYTPDWLSEQPDFLPPDNKAQWEDLKGDFRNKLDHHLHTPDQVDASKYGVFFASAGHAALIDYATATGIKEIAVKIWENGGIVSSVCHGPAIYENMYLSNGEPLINGKTITGFTTEAEDVLHIMDTLRSWDRPLVEETARHMGAKYSRPKGVWDSYHVTDGRLVTGTNPASATETAEAVIEAFSKLVNSKASLRVPLSALLSHIPLLLHPAVRNSPFYAKNSESLLIQASDSRKQKDNVHACYVKLDQLILDGAARLLPGETSEEQRERVRGLQKADNERRIRMKKAQSNKKSSRRGDWD